MTTLETEAEPAASPARQRVLIVEDEYLVAMMIEDMLRTMGYEVAGVASSLAAALAAADAGGFELAVLDINLNGSNSAPVAERLRERGVPFVFATGYGPAGRDSRFADVPTLQKPFQEDELRRVLDLVTEGT